MARMLRGFLLSLLLFGTCPALLPAAAPSGEQLFLERCAICHQPNGQGAPPVYPPLAGSDWLKSRREDAIKAICEGLSGEVIVRGEKYKNIMPAQMLDDAQAASVLSYIMHAWDNGLRRVTEQEVAAVRKNTKFSTYADLVRASAYAPLPAAPPGWTLREVVRLPEFCTRFALRDGRYYVLAQKGTVYRLDTKEGALVPLIQAGEYLDAKRGDLTTSGITAGPDGSLWIVSNQRLEQTVPYQNEVVIHRTSTMIDGWPAKPKPWLKTQYPWGIGSYNHGVSHLAFGPDGMPYVSSGSRTDGGESGTDPHYFNGGEVELTSSLWRIDPKAAEPRIEVIARGLRNAYGFAWDDAGRLFTVANGPDASEPEEMDFILPGRHYGFPYQFGNKPATPGSPYPYTPKAPEGLTFTPPVVNLGPDGGGSPEGLYTFDPHSSPCGVIWCGKDYAEPLRNRFVMARFGNLLGPPAAPADVGFDLLALEMEPRGAEQWALHARKVLAPLGRPVDVIAGPEGSIYIMEYTRPLNFKDRQGWLPGRILQLMPVAGK